MSTKKSYHCERGEHRVCLSCRCYCHLFDKGVTSFGIALKRLWTGLRSMWPLVSRNVMDAALAAKDKHHERALAELRDRHRRELENERRQIESLMPKLLQVTAHYRSKPFGRFQVMTELTDDFVYQILSTGEQHAIDYMAERMALEMRRQIHTIDFARVRAAAEYDDHRRRSVGAW